MIASEDILDLQMRGGGPEVALNIGTILPAFLEFCLGHLSDQFLNLQRVQPVWGQVPSVKSEAVLLEQFNSMIYRSIQENIIFLLIC